jgi:hypothetical protein
LPEKDKIHPLPKSCPAERNFRTFPLLTNNAHIVVAASEEKQSDDKNSLAQVVAKIGTFVSFLV